jgi:Uma2 family endonuclease
VKRDFYLSSGIAEYWIVDLDARAVERWRPESERPKIIRDRVEWPAGNAAPLIIELPALFDRISAKQHRFAQRA